MWTDRWSLRRRRWSTVPRCRCRLSAAEADYLCSSDLTRWNCESRCRQNTSLDLLKRNVSAFTHQCTITRCYSNSASGAPAACRYCAKTGKYVGLSLPDSYFALVFVKWSLLRNLDGVASKNGVKYMYKRVYENIAASRCISETVQDKHIVTIRAGLRVVRTYRYKHSYIPVGPGLQWGPRRCPGRGLRDEVPRSWSHFVNWYTNFGILENKYTKIDPSCTAMPIKNVA